MRKAIRGLAEKLHFGMEKVMPDSFIFAVLLPFIVFILAMVVVGAGPIKIVEAWHRGFWAYLAFSMQMTILLIFGYSMAITKPGTYILDKLTGVAKTPAGAVAWVSFLASMLCLVNWGLGLAGSIFLLPGDGQESQGGSLAASGGQRLHRVHGYDGVFGFHHRASSPQPARVGVAGGCDSHRGKGYRTEIGPYGL